MNCLRWLLLFLLSVQCCLPANPIPAERMIDWAPGIAAGTLPTFTTTIDMSLAPYSVVGDGTTDNSAAIAASILAAGANTELLFPAGNFKFNSQIFVDKSTLQIRGQGTNAGGTRFTVQQAVTGGASIYFRGYSSSTYATTGPMERGQTSITLVDASAISAGSYIIVLQNNSGAFLEGNIPGGLTTTSSYYQKQWVKVLSKVGNVLTIDRPLYCTYDSSSTLSTRVQRMVPIVGSGIRDIYIHQLGTRDSIVGLFQSVDCFVHGVRSTNTVWHHVSIDNSFRAQIEDCYWHYAQTYGQGGYGLSLNGSTDCLIQNTIGNHLRHSFIIQNGASGNVLFANYSRSMYDSNGDGAGANYLMPDYEIHGGNANFNLIIFNRGQQGGSDDYWGSDHHNTWWGNSFYRYHHEKGSQINSGLWAFFLNALQLSNNIVGNSWGQLDLTGGTITNGMGKNQYSPLYTGGVTDTRTESTATYHGNINGMNDEVYWHPDNADHELPDSIWPAIKPSWWGNCDWPPIGPNKTPYVSIIPAEAWGFESVEYPYYSSVQAETPAAGKKVGLKKFGF